MARRSATLLTVLALAVTIDGCCSTCLAQPLVGAVDALNWTACAATQSVCCFDDVCQSSVFGAPNYNVAQLTYAAGKAQIPSGTWLQLNWPAATNVSYMVLKTGQPKTSQVFNTSLPAVFKDNYFSMCASVVGALYFRGFATNGCRASQEMVVEIIPGNGTTCSAIPSAPVLTSDCDPVRGAVKNGVCECIADKSGPPQCLGNSPVKMAEEYAGIAGAVVSIVGAGYGLYRQRRAKHLKERATTIALETPPVLRSPRKNTADVPKQVVHCGGRSDNRHDPVEYSF
ncbi:hypothetical protein SDRG_04827 [Saprolegnia diclina VS20]|uniref:Uncharacterized protein n=1 Tax=Saprolegnia diclina (strain VS20) TaxID=1156394 RepID=T0RYV6_SAPDV|nr:hypothetical protein SDRG_04827 [Saprolegnia diclina VS20]EQC37803.1 hypothetical protein SDRG_04827 [Saprolegnia diclina VS20]|eukprot:XP_008608736.1 hypothetical protein SDRG_04827 [Saprolegnia diclina VS20]